MSFVHLHVHSEYSLLESAVRLKSLVKKAAEDGMPALALTDNGNMFGAIEFYFACLDKKIKPILGLDAYLAPGSRHQKSQDRNEIQKPNSRVVLLAMNLDGYQNLCRLSTLGYREGFYYKPRIDFELLETYNAHLICLSGGLRGDIPQTFLTEGKEKALEKIKEYHRIFGDRMYLEICRTGLPEWQKLTPFLLEAGQDLGIKCVAANDVHYLTQDDQLAQEVLICIGTNKTLSDENRYKLGTDQFYFKSSSQMKSLFHDLPELIENTLEVASRCDLKFKLKDDHGKMIYHLPTFPTEQGRTVAEEIRAKSLSGLELRFQESASRKEEISDEKKKEYFSRLDFELSIIDRMGFNGYFLIVADFINWAKKNEIPVGPGRGSGAGSLVAYSLRITDLDPVPYGLLFERFLNPERISMPDFDIDFCQDRRQEVIQYVTQKYGEASVSQIITYGRLQPKAAIKDVGRVLGMTFAEVDQVSKLVPEKPGMTFEKAFAEEPRLKEIMEMNPQVNTLIELAQRIEGLVRHAGIHAAGVIIADGQLITKAPLYRGAQGENVVQYDMKHAEKIGLIKFDFLGLKTLTHINYALKLIEKNRGKKIKAHEISIHDPGIYEIMSRGDTAGIFQFEGDGITGAIRQIRPTSFADITAINALYRPGPMAEIPNFAKRKHGEAEVEYIFPELEQVLSETYGIMVYQEQVMAIASLIAGYSLGEADMLRRAMGKKIKEEMDQHRERFLRGAKEKNFDEKKAGELFDLMSKFADYGFNKSHAAAYCVIAAQTAWLKNYYPTEFFAALLSTEMSDTDKVVRYVKDAQKRGLFVRSPHVNYSEYLFTAVGDEVYFGLGAIKGVGESAIKAILEARESLPSKKFDSLEHFFKTVDTKKLNKKVIECLIKAGAFDDFDAHRAQLMAGYHKFLDRAEEARKDRELGQVSLFDMGDSQEQKVELEKVKPWSRSASLAYEKEVLGFYLSDHPLKGFESLASVWTSASVQELPRIYEEHKAKVVIENAPRKYDPRNRDQGKKRVILAGLLEGTRELITKKGTRMAFSRLEDLTGSVELVVFPDAFSRLEALLKTESPVMVAGLLQGEEGSLKILVDSVVLLEEVLKKTKRLSFHLHHLKEENFPQLVSTLTEHPGPTKVDFWLELADLQKEVKIETDQIQGVQVSPELLENLFTQFGTSDFIKAHLNEGVSV